MGRIDEGQQRQLFVQRWELHRRCAHECDNRWFFRPL